MPRDAIIRPLTPADAEAYAALRAEMISTEPYAFLAVPGDDRAADADRIREYLSAPEQAIFGAFITDDSTGGANLIASAGIHREKPAKRRHHAHIWGVYTQPAHRGKGLQRRVMAACIDAAHAWPGVAVIDLSAAARSTAAIRLYESLGFTAWGTEPDSTRVDGAPEAEVYMQLRL